MLTETTPPDAKEVPAPDPTESLAVAAVWGDRTPSPSRFNDQEPRRRMELSRRHARAVRGQLRRHPEQSTERSAWPRLRAQAGQPRAELYADGKDDDGNGYTDEYTLRLGGETIQLGETHTAYDDERATRRPS